MPLVNVPRYEYLFHRFIRKVHGLITGNPMEEEKEIDQILSPYSKPLKECLDQLGILEHTIYSNVHDYADCIQLIKALIDQEIEEIEELSKTLELKELDLKITSRIKLYKGLKLVLNRYFLNADKFLNFLHEQAPESASEINRLIERYAEEVERGQNPSE